MIKLIILGEPTAKQRPKHGKGYTYTPEKTINYENLIKEMFMINNCEKMEGFLKAEIVAYYSIPKSDSKKKQLEKSLNNIRPTKKPDCDNVAKICLDALNKLAYNDDSQIVSLMVEKFYSETPRVEIMISEA